MRKYTGSCHCGEVVFSFESEKVTEGMRCNCSYCKRQGAVFSLKIAPQNFEILKGRDNLKVYLFGDNVVPHCFCNTCGVYVFYNGREQCKVNLGCVDDIDTFEININYYDGKNLL